MNSSKILVLILRSDADTCVRNLEQNQVFSLNAAVTRT